MTTSRPCADARFAQPAADLDRDIGWPGRAPSHKIGERDRRPARRAGRGLGARFDLRAFHDAVLAQGSVPSGMLEAQAAAWIAARRAP